ncbi:transcriptional regulator, BadM/Rrf2 family [Chryseobacterium oranimense]|uniref:Transcriptional regulator, BadM/Rrf2 family n=2 Tax=Chryseobacterium group TaxID=2782232 RepID=A0A1M5T9W1_9FLAO|nr:transcriptional regulator, BadM/Rrf2 family [Chryseobacterium oranimense]
MYRNQLTNLIFSLLHFHLINMHLYNSNYFLIFAVMLSKKSQYAFKALSYLVEKRNDGPVLISEIAEHKKIPLKFLENILLELKKADILDSKKGKGGGYFLKGNPETVKLAKIIRLVNGPIAMLPCVSLNFYEKCEDCNEDHCGLHDVLIEVRDASLNILESKTLMDLVD